MVSLETLEKSGLYDLYPEYAEEEGKESWTNRVLDLRKRWSIKQRTTPREVQLASEVASKCFNSFETAHMMLMLLTFKARKMKGKCLFYSNTFCFKRSVF